MNTYQKGFASIALLIGLVIVLVGGIGYWTYSQKQNTSPTSSAATQTPEQSSQTAVTIKVLSLISQNKTSLPVLSYRIDGQISGNTFINLVNKASGVKIWGMEDALSTNTIDLNVVTAVDGSPIKVAEGDYVLLLQDWRSGKTLAQSAVFHVAFGVTQTLINQTSVTVQKINWHIENANPTITDTNDNRKYEQTISLDVTLSDNSTKRYSVGTAYGCTGSNTESTQDGKKVLGKVTCYFAATGVNFVAYVQSGRFTVERQAESAKDGSIEKKIVLEI